MARVTIVSSGREGRVEYGDGSRSIGGYWEFGGDDVVTIVSMGSREAWAGAHAWAMADRGRILRFVADEVIRQQAPTCRAEIDEQSGNIVLRQAPGAGARAPVSSPRAQAAAFVGRFRNLREMLAAGVLAVVLIVGGLVWLGQSMMSVAPGKAVPLNESVRVDANDPLRGGWVATLMQSTDPHLRDISGRGGNETTSLSILLTPLDGGAPRLVPVVGRLSSHGYTLARIMGGDGRTVWFDAMGFYGVRLDDFTLVTPADLRAANPSLDPTWWEDPRGMDVVAGKLQVMRIDRSAAVEVDPDTWKASAIAVKPSNARFFRREVADHLAAGAMVAPGVWLGLHSQAERAGAFKPGRWIKAVESADGGRVARQLSKAVVEPSSGGDRYRVRSIAPTGERAYLEAAFLRVNEQAEPLRVSGDSVLMLHTSAPGGAGTIVVSRVDYQGTLLWSADTGLERFSLKQILPGEGVIAFVGARPPLPGKLSAPTIVLVESATGKVTERNF